VTIHSDHPFLQPESSRDAARRLRARTGGVVSLWTSGRGQGRAGLTVASLMVASGESASVLALIDPDSDLLDALEDTRKAVVQLLRWEHRQLADMFAGQAPAPGGMFSQADFTDTAWGPRLADATTWAGVTLRETTEVGWSSLVICTLDELVLGDEQEPLIHRRGRYVAPGKDADG
jgi:flavin reductase (DIM6/NTAB) family NADH-FMN oxidoreductase RutF